jgi:ferredoxin
MPRSRASFLSLARRIVASSLLGLFVVALAFPPGLDGALEIASKLQFGQALAALFSAGALYAVLVVTAHAVLTALFGRLFCSFMCPLGAALDLVQALRRKAAPARRPFRRLPPGLAAVPAVALALFWAGLTLPFGTLEPYSVLSSRSLVWGGPSLILLAVLASGWLFGRGFCARLCPVGLVLSLFARLSRRRLAISSGCLRCGRCARACPASCADPEMGALDYGSCVLCLECLAACPNGSLRYVGDAPAAEAGPVRRSFMRKAGLGALAGAALVTPDSLRAWALPDAPPPLLPPGALSLARLNAHCTLCHTCVRVCPNRALAPARGGGPQLLGKPVLDPFQGFCQYDCTDCCTACPAGALTDLDVGRKHVLRLGRARLDRLECVVVKNGTSCGACAELCPTGAVGMGPGPSGRDEPILEESLCIGCGACQHACPVRPDPPILVEGLAYQDALASRPRVSHEADLEMVEEFPF